MAIDKVVKVLIAVHRENSDFLLRELQRQGVLHIVTTEEKEGGSVAELDRRFSQVVEAIEQLGSRRKEKTGLFGSKPSMPRSEFETLASQYDSTVHVATLAQLNRRRAELDARSKTIGVERARLLPWQSFKHRPADFYALETVSVVLGRFADQVEFCRVRELLSGLPAGIELIDDEAGAPSVVIVVTKEHAVEVNAILAGARFEPVDLRGLDETPAQVLRRLESEAEAIRSEQQSIEERVDALCCEVLNLKVAADALASERVRQTTLARLEQTRTVTLISGWVRQREYAKLSELVERTGFAVLITVEPAKGEEPPVALVNRRLFRPFELVVEMFSMPSPREIDPTMLLAPFFALFFGFCLTDAGYGVVVAILAWLLLRRFGDDNKLLGMILVGGIVTVFAGAIVGGWFGDLPDRLGLAPLLHFKNRLMLFDPIKNPMPFFIISVGLGYFHMMYGILIEIADCLRVRQFGDALLGQLPWFVGLNSLVALVAFGRQVPTWGSNVLLIAALASVAAVVVFTRRSHETMTAQTFWFGLIAAVLVYLGAKLGWLPRAFGHMRWVVLAVLLAMYFHSVASIVRAGRFGVLPVVLGVFGLAGVGLSLAGVTSPVLGGLASIPFLFVAPANRALVKKFLWGGYALYSATSYIGVVLSYIRIMALGMVTGGIAMAINTIAWMVLSVPVLGIVLALVVLAGGHAYNIAVNVLGAFVHTLRLNYVEFFPRFYTGGGEPFTPFREEYHFVSVH